MKSKAIIENARKALTDIIVTYLRKYDGYLFTGKKSLSKEGDICLGWDEFESGPDMPAVRIEVDNSYLDVDDHCSEARLITVFNINGGELSFTVEGEDEPTVRPEDLTIEELAAIADFLEGEWKSL